MAAMQNFIDLAVVLANAARPEIMSRFRTGIAVDAKSDASPVTEADRSAERVMRKIITDTYPDHGILGEEYGSENVDAEFVWVLDPIDGTNSFVTGKPLFGTLIALCQNGKPIVGVIDAPGMDERWVGAQGYPTTLNGKVIKTRTGTALDTAWLYATTPAMFSGANQEAFERLSKAAWRTVYGGDCYAYGLLAAGHVDLVCEASLGTYDFAALAPVIEGAGGIITDWDGAPVTLQSDGRVLAAGDKNTHSAALKQLQS
ncbi:histidinol-phosphatase [Magnetovibrio sp.]|uniref:histidinol-phosphatase n=1 Tax=Magnetovibrio sp. TaxID=2024836 RepID=UPI002F938B89